MTDAQYRIVPARKFGWIVERRRFLNVSRGVLMTGGLSGWMGWEPWGWRPSRRWAERLVGRCVRADQSDIAWEQYKRDHTFIFGTGDEQ